MQGINYDILNQDKAGSFDKEEPKLDYISAEDLRSCERKIYELSIPEFKDLMVECFGMWKHGRWTRL